LITGDVKIRIRVIPQLPQFGIIATMHQQLGEKRLDDVTLRGVKRAQPRAFSIFCESKGFTKSRE
jgi:hypothetical protein